MKKVAYSLGLLNLADAIFTYIGIKSQLISESNPWMQNAWQVSPFLFLGIKGILSILVVFISYFLKPKRMILLLYKLALLIYIILFFYHLFWILISLNIYNPIH